MQKLIQNHGKFIILALIISLGALAAIGWNTNIGMKEWAIHQYRCATTTEQPIAISGTTSYRFNSEGNRALYIHVLKPDKTSANRKAVLFLFGGGWRTGNIDAFYPQARFLREQGYVTALADYRVICRDDSSLTDSIADVAAAHDWIVEQAGQLGIDENKVILAGSSAGGHLALYRALNLSGSKKPLGLLLFNPVVDIQNWSDRLGLTANQRKSFSPLYNNLSDAPPTLIHHGTADEIVPIQVVRKFCAKAKQQNRDCSLIEYSDAKHNFFHERRRKSSTGETPFQETMSTSVAFLDGLQ